MLFLNLHWTKPVHQLAFSPDGTTLAGVRWRSNSVDLWDLNTRQITCSLDGRSRRIVTIAFSPDGNRLAAATSAGWLLLWARQDAPDRWKLDRVFEWTREEPRRALPRLAFSPDGAVLATNELRPGSSSARARYLTHRISLIPLEPRGDPSIAYVSSRHRDEVSCLTFSPDGKCIVTGSFDRTIQARTLVKGKVVFELSQALKVHFLVYSPDGTTLASGSPSGMVRLWNPVTGDRLRTFHHKPGPLHSICYSPDGRRLATAGGQEAGVVCFWDVATGKCESAFDWEIGELHSVAFAPDGMRAAAGGLGKIVIWDIDAWEH